QETLFKQFLGGANPTRRLGAAKEVVNGPSRVEDLPWWRYNRALALWYCEWLDTYYDSGDGAFFWRDELTQAFGEADMAEVKEAAERMRLELPREGPDAGVLEELAEDDGNGCEETAASASRSSAAEAPLPAEDGDWHVAALANVSEDEELWTDAGQGNFTHWAAEVGRMFLWSETAGVLYEYLPGQSSSSSASTPPRYEALWTAQGPLAILSHRDDPQSARIVDRRGLLLGSAASEGESADGEAPFWELPGPGIRPRHARLAHGRGGWYVEVFPDAEILVDGQRADAEQRSLLLKHGSLLRLGALAELRVDLPETPDSVRPGPTTTPSSTAGEQCPAVLERGFVARLEEELPPPALSGSARARELNRALRRIICGPAAAASVGERNDALRRETLYEDRAEKRRRLHPVEWSQVPAATKESADRHRDALPQLLDEGASQAPPDRRFREAPPAP
ncbi:unnamed protein product, partial [Symbiodinium sp. KB8]